MNLSRSFAPRTPRILALAAFSALAIAVISGCSGQASEGGHPPAPEVSVAPVLIKEISQWDEFSGRVEAVETVQLRPRVSGYIDKVNYVEGQEVKKGDVLFTIDDSSYRTELARAQAELARARTQAELGRSEEVVATHARARRGPGAHSHRSGQPELPRPAHRAEQVPDEAALALRAGQ